MKPCVAPLHLYEPGEQSWALFIDPPTSYRFSVASLSVVRLSVGLPELVPERALKLKSDLSNGLCAVFVCCVTLIASSLTYPYPIR